MTPFSTLSLQESSSPSYDWGRTFICDIQSFSSGLHTLRIHDFTHHLHCETMLEVRKAWVEDNCFATVVSCNFPSINLQGLAQATGLTGYCQRAAAFLFQLKVLEKLFLFCEEQNASKIVITTTDASLDYLEIFNPFFASQDLVATPTGDYTQITIPADLQTYDDLQDFTQRLNQDFRKVLWQQYGGNESIRDYLKKYALYQG